jgi:magnesium transporter
MSDPDKKANEIMVRDLVKFSPDDDASDASKAFERYDLVSAPVINQRGKIIGRLTVDDVMDYIREESSEDMLTMAGLRGEEDIFAPILSSARNRFTWLIINLFSAFIASRVIGLFENTIEQLVALAALMPIVASVGGNTGNQTTALIIRSLSQGQITAHNTWHLIRKELGIGAVNGLVLGLLVGLFALGLYQNYYLASVIAAAMLLELIFASFVGLSVPMLLKKFNKDPALGSSVILTACTDSVGFLIFLGLASVFLFR